MYQIEQRRTMQDMFDSSSDEERNEKRSATQQQKRLRMEAKVDASFANALKQPKPYSNYNPFAHQDNNNSSLHHSGMGQVSSSSLSPVSCGGVGAGVSMAQSSFLTAETSMTLEDDSDDDSPNVSRMFRRTLNLSQDSVVMPPPMGAMNDDEDEDDTSMPSARKSLAHAKSKNFVGISPIPGRLSLDEDGAHHEPIPASAAAAAPTTTTTNGGSNMFASPPSTPPSAQQHHGNRVMRLIPPRTPEPPSMMNTPLRQMPATPSPGTVAISGAGVGALVGGGGAFIPHVMNKSRFDEEFEVLAHLGGGNFGKVMKVKKRLDGCLYAVKMVREAIRGRNHRERVLKEVYALSALWENSEHVVRYYSSWMEDGHLYIQTELCDMNLAEALRHSVVHSSSVEGYACEMLRQIISGLKVLHANSIAHLDIKPENILIKNGVFKLGDLGHVAYCPQAELPAPPPVRPTASSSSASDLDAHSFDVVPQECRDSAGLDEMQLQQQQSAINSVRDIDEGDSRYMPRELLNQDYEHLLKADIFSLGLSAYEMFLEGEELPAGGPEWQAIRDGHLKAMATERMSAHFRKLILQMIHSSPAKRPSAEGLSVTSGHGMILQNPDQANQERLRKEVEYLRALHPGPGPHLLKRANTM